MRDKTIVVSAILASLMLSMTVLSVSAWVYAPSQGIADDSKFDPWGPRIDRILVKKYASVDAMLLALQNGEIDITDWALTKTWETTFAGDPNVVVRSYGGEAGYYEVNFNHNNNPFLGNPQDPAYANPVYPNPTSVISFRQASAHMIDRVYLADVIAEGLYDTIYTPVPAYMAAYVHPDISYTGSLSALAYPPSLVDAAAKLTADGFLMGGPGGKRYWDRNGNAAYDAGEEFNLKFYSRADILRKGAADMLAAGYDDPTIQVAYTRSEVTGGVAWQICMVDKNYNIYTSGWIFIGPDPDYLYDLYGSVNYYHPEDPPNFGYVNDGLLDSYLASIKFAPDAATAISATMDAQVRYSEIVGTIALASTSAPKAHSRYYTGGNDAVPVSPDDGENEFRGHEWTHVVNQKGLGENSWYTTENAYPLGHPWGDGSMTMRYGWKDNSMPETLNPLYASWYWEWEILGRMYDSMGGRNPYTLGPFEVEFLAHSWTVSTYIDPDDLLEKSMVNVVLRSDIFWSDGDQFDADDVGYTFVDLPAELTAKGAPAVWWQPTIDQMKSYTKNSQFDITVKMNVLSVFSIGWVLGNIIVPKHLLSPFITNPATTVPDISGNWWTNGHPDLLVGTGPFLLISDDAATTVMERNPTAFNRSHPADLNYDRIVDIFDIVTIALAFGSVPGDPTWNPKADINKDGIVDIFDLAYVALNFGWSG